MEQVTIISIISVAGTISGIILGFVGHSRLAKKDTYADGAERGLLQADVTYIKMRTDDVLKEQKEINNILGTHSERITRVEESVKSAHHRIDAVEGKR